MTDRSDGGKFEFPRLRFAWLDQVVADPELPPMAFKLAWHFI